MADDLQRIANPSLPLLRALFDSGTWQRGAAYACQGRVRQLTLEEDENAALGWVINAKVSGSYGSPYDTGLDLAQDEGGQWWFRSHCSCPVGLRCKHQAALVQRVAELYSEVVPDTAQTVTAVTVAKSPARTPLSDRQDFLARKAAIEQILSMLPPPSRSVTPAAPVAPEVSRQQAFERWWSMLDLRTPQPYQNKLLDDNEVVLFELGLRYSAATSRQPQTVRATLSCRRVKQLKTKSGQPQQYGKLRAFGSGAMRGAVQSGDLVFREVAQWQWSEPSHSSGHYWNEALENSAVEDAFALQVLEHAVRSGRVAEADVQNHPGPFWQWGEPRTLSWCWDRQGSGFWALHARISGDELGAAPAALTPLLALPGPVPLYMDRRSHQIGPLDLAGLPHERVERLLAAPEFPDDWLRRSEMQPQARRLLPSLPEGVGTPVARRIHGIAPQPVLQIGFNPADGDPRFTLSFDYAGLRDFWPLSTPAQQFVETDAGLVDLARDLGAERAAIEQCRALGCMPLADSPDEVWQLLGLLNQRLQHFGVWLENDFAAWREAGFIIETGADWAAHVRHVDALDVALGGAGATEPFDIEPGAQPETAADWLHLSIGFRFGEQRFNLLPWLPQLVAQAHAKPGEALQAPERLWVSDAHGAWWSLPGATLQPWLAALLELVAERPAGAFAADSLKLTRIEALRLGAETVQVDLPGGRRGISALHDILDAHRDGAAQLTPAGVAAELRPYQRQGVAWLQALARQRLGGVLADDMGLGKTLQTIAHLAAEQASGALDRPALVVVPTSLVGNWRRECARFAPGLRVLVLHGLARREHFDAIAGHDVVLTTYPLLPRDAEVLIKQPWHVVVLDEAQTIKNAKTQAAQVVQLLQARHRLCLSGTPMENHLGEVWSLFEFLLPGYLSSEARFKALFRTPIEKHGDTARLDLLRRRLAPFMLRRTKDMVATELPAKVETVVRVQMEAPQANLYETIRLTTEETVREALREKGLARSHIMVLDALLKLRQVCCDPRLVPLAQARKVKVSAKLDWLMQTLPEMIEEGRRVLLFSQFTSMLALIEQQLEAAGLAWVKLTGQSQQRDALVERFTSGAVPIFLISLKAGGVGLNLPQADTVIHYDPWWNPAVENQATDRAHRFGQTQTVFVYKLVAEDTLEERILALQERKAALAAGLHGGAGAAGAQLTEADLTWLLKPLGAVVEETAAHVIPPVMEIVDAR
ncbi:MAG: SNF2-related protein [Leptothrix sp. (in: b-proteobacteria)]